jgi:hypothetical protein
MSLPPALALALLAIGVIAPFAYFLFFCLDLREALAARRKAQPCTCKFLKAAGHLILFLKVVLH